MKYHIKGNTIVGTEIPYNARTIIDEEPDYDKLHAWFSLSGASFLVLPRVLMQEMPLDWKNKLAELLVEYNESYPNQPDIGSRVQITNLQGQLIKTPKELINYRRPDMRWVKGCRGE